LTGVKHFRIMACKNS